MVDHLYAHVPFCDGKCHYCGFYSIRADPDLCRDYTFLPGGELAWWRAQWAGRRLVDIAPRTLYFGGGTPGALGADGLGAMIAGLLRSLRADAVEEWTVELSPATATPDTLRMLREYGVNRISLGAQCFDDDVLRAIGRRHASADIVQAILATRRAGFENIGLDLIAGLPGIDLARWRLTLRRALALAPTHLSVYALDVASGSAWHRQVANGLLDLPGDDARMDALAEAESMLAGEGFERYELSNYALPGKACRHNLACWRGGDFLGLGPAASTRIGRLRRTHVSDLAAYGRAVLAGNAPPGRCEQLTAADDATERFVTGLRLSEGVEPRRFALDFPAANPRVAEWEAGLMRLRDVGVVMPIANRPGAWRLTSRGREVADAAMRELS